MSLKRSISCLLLLCALAVCCTAQVAALGKGVRAAFDEPQTLLIAARENVQAGRIAEAIQLYKRALALAPSNLEVRRELAGLLSRRAETRAEAEALFNEAVKLEPRNAALAIEHAGNMVLSGDIVNAILEYRRAFELEPENEMALRGFIKQTTIIGGTEAAIERAQKRVRETPNDLATRLLLAELLRSDGRFNAAHEQFLLAQRVTPGNLLALRGAVRACITTNNLECAGEKLKSLVRVSTGSEPEVEYARLLLESGRPRAALWALIKESSDASKPAPEAATLDLMAECYRALSDGQRERATLEKLLQLPNQEDSNALERLARVRFEMHDADGARTVIEQLLLVDPGNSIGKMGSSLLKRAGGREPITVKAKLDGVAPADEPSLVESVTQDGKDSSLQQNPIARHAAHDRDEGEAALFWRQPSLAIAPLERALKVWPSSPRLHLALGQALLQEGEAETAINEFTNLTLENGEQRTDALMLIAQARESLHALQRALDIYDYILTKDPDNLPALSGQAGVLNQMNRTGRAAAILSRLVRRAPEELSLKARLQSSFASLGRPAGLVLTPPQVIAPNGQHEADEAKPSPPDDTYPSAITEALLDAGDMVRVQIAGRDSATTLRIDKDGLLRFASGQIAVNARCRTESELSDLIARQLSRNSASAARVEVVEFQRAPLTVAGAVFIPNSFSVTGRLDLLQGLMFASGIQESASHMLYVLRNAYVCSNIMPGHLPEAKPMMKVETYNRQSIEAGQIAGVKLGAGDLLYVPYKNTAFIVGEVAHPSVVIIESRGLTLLDAVKQVGGTTAAARRDYVRLMRLSPGENSYQEFILNMDAIERQQIGEVMLRAGDVVEVLKQGTSEERMGAFAQFLQRLSLNLSSATQTVSGNR